MSLHYYLHFQRQLLCHVYSWPRIWWAFYKTTCEWQTAADRTTTCPSLTSHRSHILATYLYNSVCTVRRSNTQTHTSHDSASSVSVQSQSEPCFQNISDKEENSDYLSAVCMDRLGFLSARKPVLWWPEKTGFHLLLNAAQLIYPLPLIQ